MENLSEMHVGRSKSGGRSSAKHVGMPWAIIAIAVIVVTVLVVLVLSENDIIKSGNAELADGTLRMYTIDVGHGDSILLISPNGKTMLIDAGDKNAYSTISGMLDELGIHKLDVIVSTHAHKDHIGSMRSIIEKYGTDMFYMNSASSDTDIYTDLMSTVERRQINTEFAWSGDVIPWDKDCNVMVLAPVKSFKYSADDLNEQSMILRVEYRNNAILLMGDALKLSEEIAMQNSETALFKADVLKVGHHGASSSTSDELIKAADPSYAVISVGPEDGHKDVTERLSKYGVTVYRTDKVGTILAVLDGNIVEVYPYTKK